MMEDERTKQFMAELAEQRESMAALFTKIEAAKIAVNRSSLAVQHSCKMLERKLKVAANVVDASIPQLIDNDELESESDSPPPPPSTTLTSTFAPPDNEPSNEDAILSLSLSSCWCADNAISYSAKTSMRRDRVAIAMLIRDPPQTSLLSFIRYHLRIGFEHIYFYFDDVSDENLDASTMELIAKESQNKVTVVHCNRAWYHEMSSETSKQYNPFVETDLIARQVLALEQALRQSCVDQIDWILHIDIDELFVCCLSQPDTFNAGTFFASIPQHVDMIRVVNMEAAPEHMEPVHGTDDYFQEITLFKTNPTNNDFHKLRCNFNCYQNGKSAVRVNADVLPLGSHTFHVPLSDRRLISVDAPYPDICLLHYPNASFELWWRKYTVLGNFPNVWIGTEKIPEGCFHLKSRNVQNKGDIEEARELYRQHVLFDEKEEIDLLVSAGLMKRIAEVSAFVKSLWVDEKEKEEETNNKKNCVITKEVIMEDEL